MAQLEYQKPVDPPAHGRAMTPFLEDWQLYRRMVDNNFLFHREAYACLHGILMEEVRYPFRFLDIACGDAGESVNALGGTMVASYHGIDLSQPALELAAQNLKLLGAPFTLERGDFVDLLRAAGGPVDVAWIGLSLHHLRAPAKLALMQDLRRLIAERGLFLAYEPASPDGEEREGWLQRYARQKDDWSAYSSAEWDTMWAHTLAADFPETESGWHALGRAAGFAHVREVFVAPTNLLRLYCFSG
jgi:SAM-dependent methyltransferase